MTARLVGPLIVGVVVGMVITLVIAGFGSYLIAIEKTPEQSADWIVVLGVLAGSIASSAVVKAKAQGMGILGGFAGGALYFVGLLCVAAIFFGGVTRSVVITALVVLCGSGLTCLARRKGGKQRKFKMPKMYA